jgi:hypothetical protein
MIRKKIEPDLSQPTYLHTVRGVGYRLAHEPEVAEPRWWRKLIAPFVWLLRRRYQPLPGG